MRALVRTYQPDMAAHSSSLAIQAASAVTQQLLLVYLQPLSTKHKQQPHQPTVAASCRPIHTVPSHTAAVAGGTHQSSVSVSDSLPRQHHHGTSPTQCYTHTDTCETHTRARHQVSPQTTPNQPPICLTSSHKRPHPSPSPQNAPHPPSPPLTHCRLHKQPQQDPPRVQQHGIDHHHTPFVQRNPSTPPVTKPHCCTQPS